MNLSLLVSISICLCCALSARSQAPPATTVTRDEIARMAGAEVVKGRFPGLLIAPPNDCKEFDGKYHQPYHMVCYGYTGERQPGSPDAPVDRYLRRFAVYTPDREALPLARRVARMLVLLYGENHLRLHFDHPYAETVQVWLTQQAPTNQGDGPGGEQVKNQIYLYRVTAERSQIEWTREVAHEYGHYALPGVTGFRAPEPWANGVLGERLFLKWLGDDLRAGILTGEELPFVGQEQLDEYIARQVTPLIRRVAAARDTFDSAPLSRQDAAAMDQYTALALYLDAVYGSAMLFNALQYTEPKPGSTFVTAPDFLRGALAALRGATEITITAPILSGQQPADSFLVYLPQGEWTITRQGGVQGWQFRPDNKGMRLLSKDRLYVTVGDWRRLVLSHPASAAPPWRLTWHRKETELH